MNIIIRKATTQDFPSILSLIKEFSIFQKTPERVTITLEQMTAEANLFQCFVAETDDKNIVGFATFFFTYYSWSGKALYLDDLYVQDAYRKLGIGKMLLDEVIALAKNNGCKKIRWQVSKWNDYAIAFYKSIGAEIDDVEINCDLILKD
jgi:ribosomal protein S18 acetylase RimI-like enzyme